MSIDTQSPQLFPTATAPQHPGWDEPSGATARGTLIVLAGRGESAGVYERFGRRLAADAYRVRVVADATLDVDRARAQVADLLNDDALPEPKVLVGSDAGAALALAVLNDPAVHDDPAALFDPAVLDDSAARVAAAILVGLPLSDPAGARTAGGPVGGAADGGVDDAVVDDAQVRSACPVHQRTLNNPNLVTAGALARPLPDSLTQSLTQSLARATDPAAPHPLRVPVLAIHGDADAVAPVDRAVAFYRTLPGARILTISGGRHDALNDVSHRSVAAAIVLFIERVRLATTLSKQDAGFSGVLPRVLNDDGF